MNTRKWVVGVAFLVALTGLVILTLVMLKSHPLQSTVYTNALSAKPGPEWSAAKIDKTKKGDIVYLGKFGQEKTILSLNALPEHQLVQVSFDLLVLQSWDGASKMWGESRWNLDVVDGPNLIQTTFGNCGFFNDNNVQNFPDNRPYGAYPAWTGSVEHQTLGAMQSWGGPERTFDCSSIYHFVLTFPHTGKDVKLCFQGYKKTKPWGLRNVQVDVLASYAAYSPTEYTNLWQKLADSDPVVAFKAKWDLIAGGPASVAFLAQQTPAATSAKSSPETPEALRLHRTRELLQVIKTPEATDLIHKLDDQANNQLIPNNANLLGELVAATQTPKVMAAH